MNAVQDFSVPGGLDPLFARAARFLLRLDAARCKKEMCDRDNCHVFLEALLKSTARQTIVLLDGYDESSAPTEGALELCQEWREDRQQTRRLVCVCSMEWLGKDYHPKDDLPIPSFVSLGGRYHSVEGI